MATDKSGEGRTSAPDSREDLRFSGASGDAGQIPNDGGSRSRTESPLNIPRPDSIPNTPTPPPTVSSTLGEPGGNASSPAPTVGSANPQESRKRRLQAAVAAQAAAEDPLVSNPPDPNDAQPSAKVMRISPPSSSVGSPVPLSGRDEENDNKERPEDAKKVPPIKIVLPSASVSSSGETSSEVPSSTSSSKSPPLQGSSTHPPSGGQRYPTPAGSSVATTMPAGIRLPYVMLGPAVLTMPQNSSGVSAPVPTSAPSPSPLPSPTAAGMLVARSGSHPGGIERSATGTPPASSPFGEIKGPSPDSSVASSGSAPLKIAGDTPVTGSPVGTPTPTPPLVGPSSAGSRPPSVPPADSPVLAVQDEARPSPKASSDLGGGDLARSPASRPPSIGPGRQPHEVGTESPSAAQELGALEIAGSPALTIGVDIPGEREPPDTDKTGGEVSVGIDADEPGAAASRTEIKSPGEKLDDDAGPSNMEIDEAAAELSADDQADPLKIDPPAEGEAGVLAVGLPSDASTERKEDEQQDESTANVEHPRKRKLKASQAAAVTSPVTYPSPTAVFKMDEQSFSNPLENFFRIKRHLEVQRRQLIPIYPKAPQGYRDYLIHRGTYVLHGNPQAQMAAGSHLPPPPGVMGIPGLRDLFVAQEKDRAKLRLKHLVEKEKLVLCVEQEILRVHGKAHRIVHNQSLPASACVMLRDAVLSNPPPPPRDPWQNPYQMICYPSNEDSSNARDSRSGPPQPNGSAAAAAARTRYNGRLFLSWLQDVDDKWEKIKSGMVLRHHNEAEALQAVQKMEWEFKLQELGMVANKESATASGTLDKNAKSPKTWHPVEVAVDDVNIPMVHVSDDFDLLPA